MALLSQGIVKTKFIARVRHAFQKKPSRPYRPKRTYDVEFTRNPTHFPAPRIDDIESIPQALRIKREFAPVGSSV